MSFATGSRNPAKRASPASNDTAVRTPDDNVLSQSIIITSFLFLDLPSLCPAVTNVLLFGKEPLYCLHYTTKRVIRATCHISGAPITKPMDMTPPADTDIALPYFSF